MTKTHIAKMASTLCSKASSSCSTILSASTLRRRLPLVGAFCVLSFGLSNLCLSSSLKTGCAQSLPFVSLLRYPPPFPFSFSFFLCYCNFYLWGTWNLCVCFLRSKFGGQSPAKSVRTIKMASSSNTVPSIVVYVTVPNKEAGS